VLDGFALGPLCRFDAPAQIRHVGGGKIHTERTNRGFIGAGFLSDCGHGFGPFCKTHGNCGDRSSAEAASIDHCAPRNCLADVVDIAIPFSRSSERERESLDAGIEKLDLECSIDDRLRLSDELMKTLFADFAASLVVDIDAV